MVQSKKKGSNTESYSIVYNAPEYPEPTPVLYLQHSYCVFVCFLVHGFVQTTDLVLNEGATQEVIRMILDIKGYTLTEPASTRVLNFGFSFTCVYSSNGGGPQAVGELWMCVGKDTTFNSLYAMGTFICPRNTPTLRNRHIYVPSDLVQNTGCVVKKLG